MESSAGGRFANSKDSSNTRLSKKGIPLPTSIPTILPKPAPIAGSRVSGTKVSSIVTPAVMVAMRT